MKPPPSRGVIVDVLRFRVNSSILIPAGTQYSIMDPHFRSQSAVPEEICADIYAIHTNWDGSTNRITDIAYYEDEDTVRYIEPTETLLEANNYDQLEDAEDF